MAKMTSAQKAARAAEKKRLRNKSAHTLCKTNITKAENLIFSGQLEPARTAVLAATRALDKAAEKKIIHPNNAARRKSRLLMKLNQAAAAPAQSGPAKSQ
ncbi:MAG: 30S ribosomal protein S20 [Chloroflexi bacterium]|nr:30S ribosomal protein S20 [Chloroflexota bacterium]